MKTKFWPFRCIKAIDACADLCSDASPNQATDPKSGWARRRSIKRMTPEQLRKFALEAHYILEFVGASCQGDKKLKYK